MKFLKLTGLLFTFSIFAQLNDVGRQEYLSKNILKNPGFESGRQRWTASAGTFTAVTSGVGTGKGAVTWDSSAASQTLTSTAVTLPSGFYAKNGVASCAIKTTSGSATHTIQAYDGTNILASQTVTSSTSAFARSSVNFIMPSSGSLSLRLVSVASNEPEVTIDDCYLGLAEGFNVGEVSQATMFGAAAWPVAANCSWSTSSTTFADYAADTDCTSPTGSNLVGFASAPATKIPGVTFTSLPPGDYLFIANGDFKAVQDNVCSWRVSDGTNSTIDVGVTGLGNSADSRRLNNNTVLGRISYSTAQSNITFRIQAATGGGGNTCDIENTSTNHDGNFGISVYRFPMATEQAYRPETKDLYGKLTYAGTTNCAWDTNSGTYANFSADTDCPTPSVSGIATAPSTKIPGVTVSNLPAGKYLVLANGRAGSNGGSGIYCAYRLHDGTSGSGVNGQYIATANDINTSISLSGVFSYTSVQSSVTFQIQGADPLAAAGTCRVNNEVSATDSLEFQIIPIDPSIPTPLLVGSVTSNSTGAERIERARVTSICTSNPCTISSQSGNWLTSIGWTTTGSYQLNIASGIFSATPSCSIVGAASGTAGVYTDDNFGTTSATTYQFRFGRTDTFAAINTSFNIICIGPR